MRLAQTLAIAARSSPLQAWAGSGNLSTLMQAVSLGQQAYDRYVQIREERRQARTYSVRVDEDDDIYLDIQAWLLARLPVRDHRSLTATTTDHYDENIYDSGDSPSEQVEQPLVRYRYSGKDSLNTRIDGHPMRIWIDRGESEGGEERETKRLWRKPEQVVFEARSQSGLDVIKGVIEGIARSKAPNKGPKVYTATRWGSWEKKQSLAVRDPSAVVLADGQMERLSDALGQFLSSEDRYATVGIPWHFGMLLHGVPGTGKAQPIDARVLTPEGWRPMGDIKRYDWVIGADGRPTEVTGIFPQGKMQIYRLTLSDGSSVEATGDHLWHVQTHRHRMDGDPGYVKTTDEIAAALDGGSERSFYVPQMQPARFDREFDRMADPLPIDPYLLGLLLGDGCFRNKVELSSADQEILDIAKDLAPVGMGYTMWPDRRGSRAITLSFHKENAPKNSWGGKSILAQHLIDLGLYRLMGVDKFIPETYLRSTISERIALLQGLMDTDGGAERTSAIFYSSSEKLLQGVVDLVECLGGTAYVSSRIPLYGPRSAKLIGKIAYRVSLRLPNDICPFRLKRKVEAWRKTPHNPPVRSIVGVEPSRMAEAQCIAVEAQDHLYVTEHGIVTHNTSAARALAARYDLDVYFLSLAGLPADVDLPRLFSFIPDRAVLLLEDVDGAHAAISREDLGPDHVSISTLLNALDGVITPHGLVFIMTTNKKGELDEALLRPGRCDLDEEIGYLTDDQMVRLVGKKTGRTIPLPSLAGRKITPAQLVDIVKDNIRDMDRARAAIVDFLRQDAGSFGDWQAAA